MTRSLFDHFRSRSSENDDKPYENGAAFSVGSISLLFLESIPLIGRIARAKAPRIDEADISDVSQAVALRIWKWHEKFQDRSSQMSREDWDAFMARTTFNEVNRYFAWRSKLKEVTIDEANSVASSTPEGYSVSETISLIKKLWQAICTLTLRQRRALLLHSPQLVIYILQAGISESEIAESLGISRNEWHSLCTRMPLTDLEIAGMTPDEKNRSLEKKAKAVKKARFDARRKLDGFRKV